ncbi:MAG: hypothetical protein IH940_07485 [Acidobacteria bacterium]|nr:hypothetical protein [Acidobacteriota bacterium]
MTTIDAHGLSVDVPKGWDGAITKFDGTSANTEFAGPHNKGLTLPVLHLANFALPPRRGDYGSGAVEIMRRGGLLICLLEFDPVEAKSSLFAGKPIPRQLRQRDFSPDAMQRTLKGMSGTQFFGAEAGRALCLYVVLGSHARRAVLVPEVNKVLATLEVA